MTDAPSDTLGNYFRVRKEKGKPGLPTLSVTMNDGLVDRSDLDRKMETNLTPEQHLNVRKGDIAYNMMRMWQGASGRADKDGIVSPAYVVVRPRESVDSRFAAHWFKSARMIHLFWAYSYGLTEDRLRLYADDFCQIPASPPPFAEQRRIADILDTWDRAIAQTEALIEAKQRFRAGLLARWFGAESHPYKTRGVPLSELCEIQYGKTLNKQHYSLKGTTTVVGTQGRFAKTEEVGLVGPAIVVGRKGSLNNPVSIAEREYFWAIDTTFIVTADKSIATLFYFLSYLKLERLDESSGVPSVSAETLRNVQVPESAFVTEGDWIDLLTSVDQELAQLNEQLNEISGQKRGLMQELLTGDMRLSSMEAAV